MQSRALTSLSRQTATPIPGRRCSLVAKRILPPMRVIDTKLDPDTVTKQPQDAPVVWDKANKQCNEHRMRLLLQLPLSQYILIHDQGTIPSCVFHAIAGTIDIMIMHKQSGYAIPINVDFLVADYQEETRRILKRREIVPLEEEEVKLPYLKINHRQITGLDILKRDGVISGYKVHRRMEFSHIIRSINDETPVLGVIPCCSNFFKIGAGDIYESKGPIIGTHMVTFVGYGWQPDRRSGTTRYLIFMNSHGQEFGDNGFGRIYFDQLSFDKNYGMYTLYPCLPHLLPPVARGIHTTLTAKQKLGLNVLIDMVKRSMDYIAFNSISGRYG